MEDRPEYFVARDRARRLGFRLDRVLQERRLAWQGEAIGMSTLRDEADLDLLEIARDARESARAVLDGRLRDRERGYLEVPFVVAATTVAGLLERAAALEADRRAGRQPEEAARGTILEMLGRAAGRILAYQEAYDAKRMLGEPGSVDLAHLLAAAAPPGVRAYDRTPPILNTDRAGLLDLLLAVRTALGDAAGSWQVRRGEGGAGLRLGLGELEGPARDDAVPEEVRRAAEVLAWLHPVEVRARVRPRALGGDEVAGLEIALEDPAARSLELSLEVLAGGEVRLAAAEEKAVRLLLGAPPTPETGPVPTPRLVALLGVLRTFDAALAEVLLPRLAAGSLRSAAAALPREATRKAPLKRALLEGLAAAHPEANFDRAGHLARERERGRRVSRLLPGDAAVLLALFGRPWSHAGARGDAPLPRGTLGDADVDRLIADLATVARIRPALEAGADVPPHEVTRLEAAALGALGRLRRIAPGAATADRSPA